MKNHKLTIIFTIIAEVLDKRIKEDWVKDGSNDSFCTLYPHSHCTVNM